MKTSHNSRSSRLRRLVLTALAAGTLAGGFASAMPSVASAGAPAEKGVEVDPCEFQIEPCAPDPDPDPEGPVLCDSKDEICDFTTETTDPEPPVDPPSGSDVVKVTPRFTG